MSGRESRSGAGTASPKPADNAELNSNSSSPNTNGTPPALTPDTGPRVLSPKVLRPWVREQPVMEATLRRSPGNFTLNVGQTPFGNYDRAVLQGIQKRWLDVLTQKELIRGRTGKVVVECRLDANGRVTDMRVVENELDDMFAWLCTKAVLEPGRYPTLPSSLRRMLKNDYRQIRFTFYY
jgi:hypothetical protein